MPSYKVKKEGFYNGVFHSPHGRNVIVTEEPFKVVPSWLSLIQEEEEVVLTREQKREQHKKEKQNKIKEANEEISFLNKSIVETL